MASANDPPGSDAARPSPFLDHTDRRFRRSVIVRVKVDVRSSLLRVDLGPRFEVNLQPSPRLHPDVPRRSRPQASVAPALRLEALEARALLAKAGARRPERSAQQGVGDPDRCIPTQASTISGALRRPGRDRALAGRSCWCASYSSERPTSPSRDYADRAAPRRRVRRIRRSARRVGPCSRSRPRPVREIKALARRRPTIRSSRPGRPSKAGPPARPLAWSGLTPLDGMIDTSFGAGGIADLARCMAAAEPEHLFAGIDAAGRDPRRPRSSWTAIGSYNKVDESVASTSTWPASSADGVARRHVRHGRDRDDPRQDQRLRPSSFPTAVVVQPSGRIIVVGRAP